MRRAAATALTLVLGAGVAHAQEAPADGAPEVKKKKKKKHADTPDFTVGTWDGDLGGVARGVGGALAGRSTLRTSGALIGVEAEATPALERGRWRLELPLEVGHRETPGTELRETHGGLAVNARWRRGSRIATRATTRRGRTTPRSTSAGSGARCR